MHRVPVGLAVVTFVVASTSAALRAQSTPPRSACAVLPDPAAALRACREALALDSLDFQSYRTLTTRLIVVWKNSPDSLAAYRARVEHAVQRQPTHVPSRLALAALDIGEQRRRDAAEQLQSVLKTLPDFQPVMLILQGLQTYYDEQGHRMMANQMTETQLRAYDLLERGPRVASTVSLDSGLAMLREAARLLPPTQIRPYLHIADILIQKGQMHEAIAAYDTAIARQPHAIAPYRMRAGLYLNLGDTAAATATLRALLAVHPNDERLRAVLAHGNLRDYLMTPLIQGVKVNPEAVGD